MNVINEWYNKKNEIKWEILHECYKLKMIQK